MKLSQFFSYIGNNPGDAALCVGAGLVAGGLLGSLFVVSSLDLRYSSLYFRYVAKAVRSFLASSQHCQYGEDELHEACLGSTPIVEVLTSPVCCDSLEAAQEASGEIVAVAEQAIDNIAFGLRVGGPVGSIALGLAGGVTALYMRARQFYEHEEHQPLLRSNREAQSPAMNL